MSETESYHDSHHEYEEHSHSHSDGHRSHHHRHHHRHHRSTKKSSPKKTFWERLKKDKKLQKNFLWLGLALLLLTAFLLQAQWITKTRYATEDRTTDRIQTLQDGANTVLLSVPLFDGDVPLANAATMACATANVSIPIDQVLEPFRDENEKQPRLDLERPVTLDFDISGLPINCSVTGTSVEILEQGASAPRVFTLDKDARSLQIPHLKTATSYSYRIAISLSDGRKTAVEGSFRTADTPRILTIGGIANVRDIGGWKTTDGKTVRQGLLYRGSELDGAVDAKFSVTQNGVHDLLSVLGVRTDFDLRSPKENPAGVDALGLSVEHIYYSTPMYADVFTASGKEQIRAVFADLADESKYPAYLHCTYGRDRTGTVCYLLEAILGLSEEDLMREYQLSALYYGNVDYAGMDSFVEQLKTFPGDTVQEKAENFLLSTGVTPFQLRQIRQIFLD